MASLFLTDNRKGKCAMTKMGKKKKKGLVAALCVIAVIVLLAAAYGIFCLIIEDDKIWADASINGVNIQGMSKKKLHRQWNRSLKKIIKIQLLPLSWMVSSIR